MDSTLNMRRKEKRWNKIFVARMSRYVGVWYGEESGYNNLGFEGFGSVLRFGSNLVLMIKHIKMVKMVTSSQHKTGMKSNQPLYLLLFLSFSCPLSSLISYKFQSKFHNKLRTANIDHNHFLVKNIKTEKNNQMEMMTTFYNFFRMFIKDDCKSSRMEIFFFKLFDAFSSTE